MKKRKILVFASTFPRWTKDTNPPFVYELSKRLGETFDIVVLAPHYPGAKRFEVLDGMKVYRFKYFIERYEKLAGSGGILPTLKRNKLYYAQVPFFLLAEYFALKQVIRKEKPDVIHAHWLIPQGLITALATNVPFIVTSHGSDIAGMKYSFIKRFVLRRAAKATVVSTELKEKVRELGAEAAVIPMGVDETLFSPREANTHETPTLLFVGRLAAEKGTTLLLQVAANLHKQGQAFSLLIIGDGPERPSMERYVRENSLSDAVQFLGWKPHDELPQYFSDADYVLSTSVHEGFGLSMVEAAMCGSFVVATDTAGSRQVLAAGGGVIIPTRDPRLFAEKLISLIKEHRTYRPHRQVVRSAVLPYRWQNTTEQFRALIGEVH